jgi:hypothetical protein
MKPNSWIVIVSVMLTGAALTMLNAQNRAQSVNGQVRNTNTSSAQSDNTTRKTKVLVKRLPNGVEGVELKDGKVRLKDGYKFVKHDNGTVTVARMNNGLGVGGSWKCTCDEADGECEAVITNGSISCKVKPFTCNNCSMTVVVGSVRTTIMQ